MSPQAPGKQQEDDVATMRTPEELRTPEQLRGALATLLESASDVAVAVSGGVDSMTLAAVCARELGARAWAYHAVSPAVPPAATERVREYARRYEWQLRVIEAGEFDDPEYRANPFNRCYFCKRNLYDRIAEHTTMQVFSGANADDLGDFRPGLVAAAERAVRHPFVELNISKAEVRALAQSMGLVEVQDLPAMPCLSSRVESGIRIEAADLAFVNEIEDWLRESLGASTVRCRIGHAGVRVELDDQSLAGSGGDIEAHVRARCEASDRQFVGFVPYARGSAFLRPEVA